jgi:hypothetical protein
VYCVGLRVMCTVWDRGRGASYWVGCKGCNSREKTRVINLCVCVCVCVYIYIYICIYIYMETQKSATQISHRTHVCLKVHFNFLPLTLEKLSFQKRFSDRK